MFFKADLIMSDHVKHFAQDLLGMYPLMYAFLLEKIEPRGLLPGHIECFIALYTIICILRRGLMNEDIYKRAQEIVSKHARLLFRAIRQQTCQNKAPPPISLVA